MRLLHAGDAGRIYLLLGIGGAVPVHPRTHRSVHRSDPACGPVHDLAGASPCRLFLESREAGDPAAFARECMIQLNNAALAKPLTTIDRWTSFQVIVPTHRHIS